MDRRFVIELLGLENGKAYGFQEYVFNLLNFFYVHRGDIRYERIIIWCKGSSREMFKHFEDKFEVESYDYSSYLKKHWIQTVLPFKYGLTKKDLLFSPGNVSGLVKCSSELLTIHDLLFKRKEWLPSKLMRWQREFLIPISIHKADKIVAISEFTKADVEHFYPMSKGKMEVIYNSFNFNKYEGKETFAIGAPYFFAISTNAEYKNQKTIIKAFQKYCAEGGEKKLVIVGRLNVGTEAYTVYHSMTEDVKMNIVWLSGISNEELGALYRDASCFISASKFEGLGMPVVEAMSFGLPVLLSDIPPHREVSMNLGDYFEPTDVDALSEKMLNMDFERRDYGERIRSKFSEENTSAKYVELINQIYVKTHLGGAILRLRFNDYLLTINHAAVLEEGRMVA